MRALVLALLLAAPAALAQQFGVTEDGLIPLPDPNATARRIPGGITVERLDIAPVRPRRAPVVATQPATRAVLRGLDKVTGEVTDLEMAVGDTARVGRLTVRIEECRVPRDNPSGDAFAALRIAADGMERPAFEGWMIASSPALSALDHPRYDIWVMRCSSA